jgi:subtilisin family serine protease
MCDLGGGYTTSSGTSFGSPMVAALAGMALSVNPNLTPAQVADVIRDGADDVAAPGFDTQTGWGRINVATTLGLVDTTVDIFGAGTLTAQGKLPQVGWGGGSAVVGNSQFQLELDDVRAGSTAFLVVGLGSTPVPTPFVGGNFYVDLSKPVLWDVRVADLNSHAEVPFAIPADPGLQGANFTAQWVVVDPVAQFALSAALVATIDV